MTQHPSTRFRLPPTRAMSLTAGLAVILLAGCSAQRTHTISQSQPPASSGTVAAAAPATASQPQDQAQPDAIPQNQPQETASTTKATRDVTVTTTTGSGSTIMTTAQPTRNNGATKRTIPNEDKDMTVLVLDNAKLLAQAARLKPEQTPIATNDSPRQPQQTLFHYAFDAHKLSDADRATLQAHGRYLAAHPNLRVKLIGHTDSQGPRDYNLFLSRLRAADAAKVMEEAGAKADQIDIEGVGSSQPESPQGDYAANRRLDLHYLNPALAESR